MENKLRRHRAEPLFLKKKVHVWVGLFMQSFLLFADFQIKLKMFNATTNKIAVTINRQQIYY